jgi:hypothetical protein
VNATWDVFVRDRQTLHTYIVSMSTIGLIGNNWSSRPVISADGNRVDYELPRSESVDYAIPWKFSVKIKGKRPIATVYSPTHALEVKRTAETSVSAQLAAGAANQPGPLRISYLLEGDGVSASLFAYPDGKAGGYFLLLAGVPAQPPGPQATAPPGPQATPP